MFDLPTPSLPTTDGQRFPVGRIFLVGKNYRDHAAEMGEADAEPVFFTKPATAVFVPEERGPLPYPLATEDLHHEAELVVALGADAAPIGACAGCDLTRRDLQRAAKAKGEPWDAAKALDDGAVLGPLTLGPLPTDGPVRLRVNGTLRQDGRIEDMVLNVARLLERLAALFRPRPGDLIFTGTPAGVGALVPGDEVAIDIAGCAPLAFSVAPR